MHISCLGWRFTYDETKVLDDIALVHFAVLFKESAQFVGFAGVGNIPDVDFGLWRRKSGARCDE